MRTTTIIAATLALGALATSPVRAADVHVGVHIGIPAPPVLSFPAPPHLVVVPGVPSVYYAPDVDVNFFTYGDRYYTYYDGGWFYAYDTSGPWTYVERRYVPAPILHVPTRYYRVPPRLVGGGHWHGDHDHGWSGGKARYHHGNGGNGHWNREAHYESHGRGGHGGGHANHGGNDHGGGKGHGGGHGKGGKHGR